jgi:hypothetical protein
VSLGTALMIAILLTALTIGGSLAEDEGVSASTATTSGALGDDDEEELLDYERTPTPAAVLQQQDSRLITLTQLTAQRAALLIFVTEGCGPCERVLDHAEDWIDALEDTLQVRFVFSRPLDRVGAHALHDLQFTARTAPGATGAPSAVLLGADGQLAGGPVNGGSSVIEFVEEIQEQLAEARGGGGPSEPAFE